MSIQPIDFLTPIEPPPDIENEEDLPEFSRWLDDFVQQLTELLFDHGYAINQVGVGNLPYAQLNKLTAPPKSPQPGWIAYADGTSWNPGGGEGYYGYKADNAWHKIV